MFYEIIQIGLLLHNAKYVRLARTPKIWQVIGLSLFLVLLFLESSNWMRWFCRPCKSSSRFT